MFRALGLSILSATLLASSERFEAGSERSRTAPPQAPSARVAPWLGRFEENLGQAPPWARYLVRTQGLEAALTDRGAVFALPGVDGSASRCATLRMELEGARPEGEFVTGPALPGRTHVLRGRDPSRWVRGARSFGSVTRRQVRPGADLAWNMRDGLPEYRFRLAAGVDPSSITLRFEGAESLRVAPDGSLEVATRAGVLRHGRPTAWQGSESTRGAVPVRFELRGPARAGFRVDRVDPSRPLTIDPVISFSSHYGGAEGGNVETLVPEADGSLLLVGNTFLGGLATADALDTTVSKSEILVVKIGPVGSTLLHATYLGGTEDDVTTGAAVDAGGRAWIAGFTKSADFPVWAPFQGTLQGPLGSRAAFLLRLLPGYDGFEFSTYFGGPTGVTAGDPSFTGASDMALTPGGDAVIAGNTNSVDLPTLSAFQPAYFGGLSEAFVARFSGAGELLYSSYLGGSTLETAVDVVTDPDGAAFVAGWTRSDDFPAVGDDPAIRGTFQDAFVAKVSADGSALEWCQAFGGVGGTEEVRSVTLLPSGDVFVGGKSDAPAFPIVNTFQTAPGYAFLSRFSGSGGELLFSTRFGGTDSFVSHVQADTDGTVLACGQTRGQFLPLVSPLYPTATGSFDSFLVRLLADNSGFEFSTYLGGLERPALGLATGGRVWIAADGDENGLPPIDLPVGPQVVGLLRPPARHYLQLISRTTGPPGMVTAQPMSGIRIRIRWLDETDDETGFEVQRRQGAGEFVAAFTVPANSTTAEDGFRLPLTTYGYRVRALTPAGPTAWSEVAETTTLDVAPQPPTGVTVAATSTSTVQVTWTAGSANVDAYEIHRRFPGGVSFLRAVVAADVTQFDDGGLPPAGTVGYFVRALNEIGTATSDEGWGATAGTLSVTLSKGSLKSRLRAQTDALRVSGTLSFDPSSPDAAWDPVSDGFSLRIGDGVAPSFVLDVPSASPLWRYRAGAYRWKSGSGSPYRATVEFRPLEGRFKVSVARAEFAGQVPLQPEVRISSGNDAGTLVPDWEETRPGSGSLRYPPRNP